MAVEDEVGKSGQTDEDSNLAYLEHAHSLASGVLDEAVHHQIGACADECAGAAQDGGVAQGDEELGVREPDLLRPVLDDRGKDDHDRRVVEEGRQGSDGRQESCIGLRGCGLAPGHQAEDDVLQQSASPHSLADKEKQGNSYHAFVREAFQTFLRRQDAAAQHQHDAGEEDESGLQHVLDECPYHEHQTQGYKYYVKRHRGDLRFDDLRFAIYNLMIIYLMIDDLKITYLIFISEPTIKLFTK